MNAGEYTALSTKGIATILSDSLWRVITFPITYLLILVLVVTALMQIRYVNRALQRFPSTQVIPTQFVLFTISVIIGSAVLYRDFESATPERISRFIGGCFLTFLGVYLITGGRRTNRDNHEEDGEEDGEGNHITLVDEEGRRTPQIQTSDLDGLTPKSTSFGDTALSRENTQLSGRTTSYQSGPIISVTSFASQGQGEGIEAALPESPWRATAESIPYQSNFHQHSVYGMTSNDISSSSCNDHTNPLRPHPELSRSQSLARRSMSRIFPNPIVTPLSSSLNGIVAESLRQGIDSPGRKILRRSPEISRSDSMPVNDTGPLERPSLSPESTRVSEPLLLPLPTTQQSRAPARSSRARNLTSSLRSLLRQGRQRSRSRGEV